MKKNTISDKDIMLYKEYLIENERSKATIEKYIRDVIFLENIYQTNRLIKKSFWNINLS